MNETFPMAFLTAVLIVGLASKCRFHADYGLCPVPQSTPLSLWYFGNVAQSGLSQLTLTFGTERVNWAFVQIAIFALAFRVCLPVVGPLFAPAGRLTAYDSRRPIGRHEARLVQTLGMALAVLTTVGLWRVGGDVFSVIFPPLSSESKSMFGRSAIGSGLDFLVSLAEYTHLAVGGLLGMALWFPRLTRMHLRTQSSRILTA